MDGRIVAEALGNRRASGKRIDQKMGRDRVSARYPCRRRGNVAGIFIGKHQADFSRARFRSIVIPGPAHQEEHARKS